MHRTLKLGLAALLLVGGLAVASLFRREVPQPPSTDSAADLVLRRDDGPRFLTEAAPTSSDRPIQLPASLTPPVSRSPEKPAARRKRREANSPMASLVPFAWADPAPPAIEWEYPGAPSGPRKSWSSSAVTDWPAAGVNWPNDWEAEETTDSLDGRMRRHTIVDGDTLETLARRYLGDATRAHDLFDMNRDVLTDPQMLPIGAELRIPPRQQGDMEPPLQLPLAPVAPRAAP